MAKLFSRLYRSAKRRIKKDLRDQRTFNLYRVATRLLADHDHEHISVAQLAREAGISVGAFYQRFPNKDAFLSMVVSERMRSAQQRMERDLDSARWKRSTPASLAQAVVVEMMRELHGPGAGVVRAALKRGHLDRKHLEPLIRYRTALADHAVALLTPRAKGVRRPERAVRGAMQMAQATALDALLHDAGTLRPGSQRMADTLTAMLLGMLDLGGGRPMTKPDETEGTAAEADNDDQDAMLAMPIEEVIAHPVPEPAPGAPRARRRRAVQEPKPEPIKIVRPKNLVPATAEEPQPPVRRRHRPQF